MNPRLPIDKFMIFNNEPADFGSPGEMTAIYETMDIDDFDAAYGLSPGDVVDLRPHYAAYKEMNSNEGNLVILYECPHYGNKHRHHPDYKKPLEVELLCQRCHAERHREVLDEHFNRPFSANSPRYSTRPQDHPTTDPSGLAIRTDDGKAPIHGVCGPLASGLNQAGAVGA